MGRSGEAPAWVVDHARGAGQISKTAYRCVVAESDGRVAHCDFVSLAEARQYADDVASEGEIPPAAAYVLDHQLRLVHRGRHYAG